MLSGRAEAGHASRLDSLPAAIDLDAFGVRGNGCPRIDESGHPPRMIWSPNRSTGFDFYSTDHDKVEESRRALEEFHAEAIALGSAGAPTLGTANLEKTGATPRAVPSDEAHRRRIGFDDYVLRMQFLRDEATHDGYVLNPASEIDFRRFIDSAPDIRKGNLVLMDNGNLRAIWKDEQGARLGLQFLGGGMVQYVICKRRKYKKPISRVAGRDSLEGIKRQIHAFELHSSLCE